MSFQLNAKYTLLEHLRARNSNIIRQYEDRILV